MPFGSKTIKYISKNWNFNIVTSSPQFAQSNGLVEHNVQTVKAIFKKAKESGSDNYGLSTTGITEYTHHRNGWIACTTPDGTTLTFKLPNVASQLATPYSQSYRKKLKARQIRQKLQYDRNAKRLPPLKANDVVRYLKGSFWAPAIVVKRHSAPRSYIIQTSNGTLLRRSCRHLKKTAEPKPKPANPMEDDDDDDEGLPIVSEQSSTGIPSDDKIWWSSSATIYLRTMFQIWTSHKAA